MLGLRSGTAASGNRRELLTNLTLRDLRGQYNRSVLGWTWSVLNPLVTIVVYSLVFSIFLKVEPSVGDPSELRSYGFFLVSALLPWTFLAVGLSRSAQAITGNQALVTKAYFSRAALPGSIVASSFVTLLIEMGVLVVVFLVATDNNVIVWLPVLAIVLALLLAFVWALGLLAATLNVYFRDVGHLINIGLQPWFFLTPVIYPLSIDQLGGSRLGLSYRDWLQINPMTHFVTASRNVLYDLRFPSATTWLAMVVSVAVAWVIAAFAYHRLEPRMAEEI